MIWNNVQSIPKRRTHFIVECKVGSIQPAQSGPTHISSESRKCFLERTRTEFHFETYINFALDVVYIRPVSYRLGYGPFQGRRATHLTEKEGPELVVE